MAQVCVVEPGVKQLQDSEVVRAHVFEEGQSGLLLDSAQRRVQGISEFPFF